MRVCLVLGSSLHLCLKAGQLSVVTITRRCRCCLDGLIIAKAIDWVNRLNDINNRKSDKRVIIKVIILRKKIRQAFLRMV